MTPSIFLSRSDLVQSSRSPWIAASSFFLFSSTAIVSSRLYKRVRPQAIFERSYGFLSSFAGRTISFFPSSKTTNEEWANRQQRKTLPARFSVLVLLMKQSHSSTGVLMREARLLSASEALLN